MSAARQCATCRSTCTRTAPASSSIVSTRANLDDRLDRTLRRRGLDPRQRIERSEDPLCSAAQKLGDYRETGRRLDLHDDRDTVGLLSRGLDEGVPVLQELADERLSDPLLDEAGHDLDRRVAELQTPEEPFSLRRLADDLDKAARLLERPADRDLIDPAQRGDHGPDRFATTQPRRDLLGLGLGDEDREAQLVLL